ncbi:MAG: tetratricopeptide repeat protein, partial [Elainella sp.]
MRLKSKRLLLLGLSLVVSLLTILGWPLVSIGSAPTGSAPTRSIATEPSISQPQQTQSLLEQGLSQYEAEQFAAAIQSWQQALVTLPHSSWQQGWIWNSLALAYQQLGRWDEAEAAVQQGLAALTDLETADPKAAAAPRAKLLNTQGRWHWYRNQPEQALQSWQQAALAYQQADDRTGLTISLINQARAFQSLGFSSRAETLLEQVENLQHQEADPALKATGLRDLGNALRRIGKLQDSRELLQSSLEVSSQVQASERAGAEAAIYLDLGNTERALGYKAVAIGDRATAQIQFQQALATYQQAVQASERSAPLTAPLAALQAQLNQFSLLIELNRRSEALAMTTLRTDLEALPATRTSLYARLNYAHSMAKAVAQDSVTPDQPVLKDLARFLAQTGEQAKALGDRRAESYALGELGELYERAGQWGEAETLTQQALLQAEALQAADVRYRWEWQLGRLLKQQGNQSAALAAYQAAVESLQSVRNDLLSVSDEVQFSFRDDVEPVYRGLVELLLTDGGPNPAVSQANLKQAIQQINALQLAELNNFLGCNLAQIVELDDV